MSEPMKDLWNVTYLVTVAVRADNPDEAESLADAELDTALNDGLVECTYELDEPGSAVYNVTRGQNKYDWIDAQKGADEQDQ